MIAYRKLVCPNIERLPPVQGILYLLVVFFVPLFHLRLRGDAHDVDDIHCVDVSISGITPWYAPQLSMLTMIRGNQLVHAMVLLAALDCFPPIMGSLRELVGPVHPVDSGIHVVFVARADFQDACNPVVVRLLPGLHGFVVIDSFLALDAEVVRDVDEAFAEVLDPIHCGSSKSCC